MCLGMALRAQSGFRAYGRRALDSAFEHGFSRVYFVWWNESVGWYGITVPEGFARLTGFWQNIGF
jgi:hypothetical protein